MNVPLLDLKAQFDTIEPEIREAIDGVLETQRFIMGPEIQAFESEVAEYSQCAHGIGVSSGSDALLIALMALDVGPGDEVVTTPYTFFATAGVIARLRAKPVFVDIEPDTYNIDPDRTAAAVTDKTRAIIPVHLYGQCAEMDPILEAARAEGVAVIEDAAQAIGAEYKDRRAGSMGTMGCFSFFPSKNLGGFGDGGMVVCQDEELAERLRVLRMHGSKPKYYHSMVGGNFRLDALQAAILRVKLRHLDGWSQARSENAERYTRLFCDAGIAPEQVKTPAKKQTRHIYNQYVISVERRDELKSHLAERGVGTEIYYPVPMHLQECFKDLDHAEGDFPVCEAAAKSTLALPIYPELSDSQQAYVVESIKEFYQR